MPARQKSISLFLARRPPPICEFSYILWLSNLNVCLFSLARKFGGGRKGCRWESDSNKKRKSSLTYNSKVQLCVKYFYNIVKYTTRPASQIGGMFCIFSSSFHYLSHIHYLGNFAQKVCGRYNISVGVLNI